MTGRVPLLLILFNDNFIASDLLCANILWNKAVSSSKITSMTLDEMRAAHARGESRTDWERVRRDVAADVEPVLDDDSPDASDLIEQAIAKHRAGRLSGNGTKK